LRVSGRWAAGAVGRGYEHLVTKADLKDLELRLTSDLRSLETRLTVRLMLVVSLATGVVVAVDRLWS